ncbi:hypothetical protein JQ633_01695 [Bradyrhizobium tropiciagri]|uniref:hypothetical protein n=1 Tax=Bradyrhizobium tropiciagri TaxID=312253 RepID=UPI001BABB92A|nr:hypothetical protein [Bradyrhizobium tropiciagri]MBR0869053.1 hypothetical protein [Bradyrhizobium tropiciagri]
MRALSSLGIGALLHRAAEALFKFLAWIGKEPATLYRPEAHYMRGPGPAWRAKHHPDQVASLRRVR